MWIGYSRLVKVYCPIALKGNDVQLIPHELDLVAKGLGWLNDSF